MLLRDRIQNIAKMMLEGQIRLDEASSEFEKIYIETAMELTGAKITKAAKLLGVHRNTLSKRLEKYDSAN